MDVLYDTGMEKSHKQKKNVTILSNMLTIGLKAASQLKRKWRNEANKCRWRAVRKVLATEGR